ncbi:MAG: Rossmann-like and DUF2520 domain-containing protein [Rikenellaceae bacterium]
MENLSVVIIGTGGVAESLAVAISKSETLDLVQVWGRNLNRAMDIVEMADCWSGGEDPMDLEAADIYIMAISDRAVARLSSFLEFPDYAVVVHTAGSVPITDIAHPNAAVLYPMQTFSVGRQMDFARIPLFIEGSNPYSLELIREVAEGLSSSIYEMSSEGRKSLHLCAVFACNFTNAMCAATKDLAEKSGLTFEVFKPLIEESFSKILSAESPRAIQTGPAARGDKETQECHEAMLQAQGEGQLEEIYKLISKYIWETSKKM